MVPLLALRFAYAFWKHTFALSKKLSGPTWIALAALNASIAATSFWASRAELVPSSAIPPIAYIGSPFTVSPELPRLAFTPQASNPTVSSISPNPVPTSNANQNVSMNGSNFQAGLVVDVFNSSGMKLATLSGSQMLNVTPSSFTMVINLGSTAGTFGIEVVNPSDIRSPLNLPEIRKLREQVVLNITSSDAPSLLTPTQQVVAILVGIFTTFFAAFNAFIAWQVYQRTKSQEILLRLQIAKLERELADQRAQDEESRKEAEKSSLILLS